MIPLFDLHCPGCGAAYPAAPGTGLQTPAADRLPSLCPRCGGFWAYGDRLAWGPPRSRSSAASEALPGLRAWAHLFGLEPAELADRRLDRAAQRVEHPLGVIVSQQGSPPAGSFKERGAEVLAAACARRGLDEVFLDSSGNAGIAMARSTAERGIACRVLVPETTPASKIARLHTLGARVDVIRGDRRAAHDAAQRLASELPYASHIVQPYFHAGVATLAWDLDLELGRAVERILLPAGNGSLLLGLELGFDRLVRAGKLDRIPPLHAVQLAGFAALDPGGPGKAPDKAPHAAGIAITDPPRRRDMAAAVEGSGGDVTVVTDEEILHACDQLAVEGFATDPTGATAWAGLRKRPELAGKGTVVILTSIEVG